MSYLFVPPGYKGALPAKGYHVAKPRTNRQLIFYRAFVEKGNVTAAVAGVKAKAGVFPLSQAAKPPATSFGQRVGRQVQHDQRQRLQLLRGTERGGAEQARGLVTIRIPWDCTRRSGIRKGQPFAPDARMKGILTDSVAVANAIARTNLYASRDPKTGSTPTANGRRRSWAAAISFSTARNDC